MPDMNRLCVRADAHRSHRWGGIFRCPGIKTEGRLCAQAIIDAYAVGSGDWSWTDERALILLDHSERFYALAGDISFNGVREPVLLGDDGRVWDGHHRILAAHYCDPLFDIPVIYGTGGNQ